jgi:hypothetical protein
VGVSEEAIMKRVLIALFALALGAGLWSSTQSGYTLTSIVGRAEAYLDFSWKPLALGDRLIEESRLRLSPRSAIELSSGAAVIRIAKSGQYSVKELAGLAAKNASLASSPSAPSASLFSPKRETTLMGQRGASLADRLDFDGADPEVVDAARSVQALIDAKDYAAATQAALGATARLGDMPELSYLEAQTRYLGGDGVRALDVLRGIDDGVRDTVVYADYVALYSTLLYDFLSYEEALSILSPYIALRGADDSAQGPYLLSALCHIQLGDLAKARDELDSVIALGKAEKGDFYRKAVELRASLSK